MLLKKLLPWTASFLAVTNNPIVSLNVIARRNDEANRRFDEVNPDMKLSQESKLMLLKKP